MSWGRELAWDRKTQYDYQHSHEFDPEESSSYIDVKVGDKCKNYQLAGVVKFHLENGSIEEHRVPDNLCDLDVDELKVWDLSDPNIDAIKLDKCPDQLESWLNNNLLDHISND